MTTLYQESINNYIAQIYRSQPAAEEIIPISSHRHDLISSNKFTFHKPDNHTIAEPAAHKNNNYFIHGITISGFDNLDEQQTPDRQHQEFINIELICGGQTWIKGQLGLLDAQIIKDLLIPIPAPDVEQEIELIISSDGTTSNTTNNQEIPAKSGCNWLTYDVVGAPDFQGDGIVCARQIIYQVPDTGIIHNGNGLLGCRTNCYARLEIYVPNEIIYEPEIIIIINLENIGTETHNLISHPHQQISHSGYKIYKFDMSQIAPNSMIKLHQVLPSEELGQTLTQTQPRIKYSFVENQVARMKNGYIGLSF